MKEAEQMTIMDVLFDVYNNTYDSNDIDDIERKELKKQLVNLRKVGIEFNTYHKLNRIAEDNGLSVIELINYIYMLYLNEFKINNTKHSKC
jgi:hypothetical protein